MNFRFATDDVSLRDRLQPPAPKPAQDQLEKAAAQALVQQRGRQTIAVAPKAGKAAAALLRPLLPMTGLGLNELKRRWDEIVGAPYANKTYPEKLSAGVLTLRASSALAPFLQQQTPLILERLKLAGAKVKTIRIEQRSAAPAPKANVGRLKRPLTPEEDAALAQSLDHVGDDALRSALLRLGRAVKQG